MFFSVLAHVSNYSKNSFFYLYWPPVTGLLMLLLVCQKKLICLIFALRALNARAWMGWAASGAFAIAPIPVTSNLTVQWNWSGVFVFAHLRMSKSYWEASSSRCLPKRSINSSCINSDQCQSAKGLECIDFACDCDGYR